MKVEGRKRRYQRQLARGRALVWKEGLSIRKAAEKFTILLSTIWREIREKRNKLAVGSPTALKLEEEAAIVKVLTEYAERGRSCTRTDISDMVEIVGSRMTPSRREEIRFRSGRPGRDYIKNFLAQHKESIRFGKVSSQ